MGTRAKPSARPVGGRVAQWFQLIQPGLVAAALMLLAAPYVGMAWEALAPTPTYLNVSGEVFLENQDSSEFIAADGWFLLVGLLAGVLTGALGYWRWRGNLAVILITGTAAIACAVIAREVGEAFGPAPIEQTALSLPDGERVEGALDLGASAVLASWPVGVLVTYLSLVGGLGRRRADPATSVANRRHVPSAANPTPDGDLAARL